MYVWLPLLSVFIGRSTLQGQEVVAENAMDVGSKDGHWVILQVGGAYFMNHFTESHFLLLGGVHVIKLFAGSHFLLLGGVYVIKLFTGSHFLLLGGVHVIKLFTGSH